MKLPILIFTILICSKAFGSPLEDAILETKTLDQDLAQLTPQKLKPDSGMEKVEQIYLYVGKDAQALAIDDLHAIEMENGVMDIKTARYYIKNGSVSIVRTSDTFIFISGNCNRSKPFVWGGDLLKFDNNHLKEWFVSMRVAASHDDPSYLNTEKFFLKNFSTLFAKTIKP